MKYTINFEYVRIREVKEDIDFNIWYIDTQLKHNVKDERDKIIMSCLRQNLMAIRNKLNGE